MTWWKRNVRFVPGLAISLALVMPLTAFGGLQQLGVLAPESTVAGGAYPSDILQRCPTLTVHARPSPLLVALAEEGEHRGEFCASVLRHYLHGFFEQASIARPATVLLGCTHFPVFREALGELLGADNVRIVDSAETTAQVVCAALAATTNEVGAVQLLATDGVARFRRVGRHFLGATIDTVELVDL